MLVLTVLAGVAAAIGLFGLVLGVATRAPKWRTLGLRAMRGGWGMAGVMLVIDGLIAPANGGIFYGVALLVVAVGATAIQAKPAAIRG